MNIEVTGIEAQVCQEIARRQKLGLQKYGITVEDSLLAITEWVRHAKEEALDMAIYLTKLEVTIKNLQDDHK
jgi:nicotinamidase-related amidase